jgi:presequence protease
MSHSKFSLVRDRELSLLGVHARLLRHDASGAEVLHLANDEPNFTFVVGFATTPSDDTGVAHILEHMVLAGSERFPVKDPFFEMVKGSVAGFINAMTWPDRTIYPFATDHPGDYLNLMHVYLDAVFRPRLTRETFDQEAWHLEPGEDEGTLRYRGVVFNEMKGAAADPDRALDRAQTTVLLHDTPYRFDSGGDPAAIPDLSYENLLAFHRDHYHPSRARFLLHGDVPLEASLTLIASYLEGVAPQPPLPLPNHPTPFDGPRSAHGRYPADAKGKAMATITWALPEIGTLADLLAWELLERVLIGTPAAPLRRALLDANLGEAFIGDFSDENRTATFEVGLRGVDPAQTGAVHALVLDALQRIAGQGIEDDDVLAARNRIEFGMRELDAWGGQRGLAIGLAMMGRWFHGHDPLAELDYEGGLRDLDARMARDGGPGAAITVMIRDALLAGRHRVDTTVTPDAEMSAQRQQVEDERLAAIAAAAGAAGLAAVTERAAALEAHQQRPDDDAARATLPRLRRADLAEARGEVRPRSERRGSAELVWVDQPTRGLLYLDLSFDLGTLPAELLPHVGILGRALLETGTSSSSLAELSRRIDRDTGGLSASFETHAPIGGVGPGVARFMLRGKALAGQASTLAELLAEVLTEANLTDLGALRRLVLETLARRRNALERSGTQFAAARLAAHASAEARLAESLGGLASLDAMAALVARIDADGERVQAEFETLRSALLGRATLVAGITADAESAAAAEPAIAALLAALPEGAVAGPLPELAPPAAREGWNLAGQVNYTAVRWNLRGGERLPGAWLAATRHLSADVLIPLLRFQGGAYGAGAALDPLQGSLTAIAYRDPNLEETLATIRALPQHLRDAAKNLDDDGLDTLIVGSVGKLDPYALPGATGYRTLLRHLRRSEGETTRLRHQLLACERRDFLDLADAIDAAGEPTVAVLGPKGPLATLATTANWTVRDPG